MRRKSARVLGLLIIAILLIVAAIVSGWYLLQPKSQGDSQTTSGNEKVNTPPTSQDGSQATNGNGNNQTTNDNEEVNTPPTVTLVYPVGGKKLSGIVNISWSASDPDNDTLSVTIEYTTDPAPYCPTCPPQRWHIISISEDDDGKFQWDTTKYPNGQNYQLKVIISDGKSTAQAVSGTFSINN